MNRASFSLILVAVLALLSATLYFTRDHGKDKTPAALTTLQSEAITTIALEHPGAAAILLRKHGEQWRLEAPVQGRADTFEVAGLLAIATQKAYRELPLADVDPAELKLAPAQYTLRFDEQTLQFGDVDPIEYRRYVRIGDQVKLTDDPPATAVDADFSNLVAKELLPPKAGIRVIDVPGLRVARDANDQNWQATPASELATAASAARFVEAWRTARAMWISPMPDDGGKGAPITITLDDETITLHLVAREPQLLLDHPAMKVRYALSKADADSLLQLVAAPAKKL